MIPDSADLRDPAWRVATFTAFYGFHTRYGTHPGLVYALLPWLAAERSWTPEEYAWFCFLNGNTQNPVTSLLIHDQAPSPRHADRAVEFWRANYGRLAWDTDRRYHKKAFDVAVTGYLALTGGRQVAYWRKVGSWRAAWRAAEAIPTFGRLSAWSFLEYVYLAGFHDQAPDDLMLADRDGSRSHRNGLCIVDGLDHLDWHKSNPGFDGRYAPDTLAHLEVVVDGLLADARALAPGDRTVTRFTLESALCTYKSWHRPRRRYPNVYADMHYERVRAAEAAWPEADLSIWWMARADLLPPRLLLERNPGDPGVHPDKQNQYRETGRPPMMEGDGVWSPWPQRVADLEWGLRR